MCFKDEKIKAFETVPNLFQVTQLITDLIEIPGVDVVAKIPADTEFAANDIRGRSVMQLPADDALLMGAKEALTNMGIL